MILVSGARGVVGAPLVQSLAQQARPFLAVSRSDSESLQWDMRQAPDAHQQAKLSACQQLIHCAPIWLLTPHLPLLVSVGIQRMVVFSSTSVLSKRDSADPAEQELARVLAQSEAELQQACAEHAVELTILRPSMIYGYGRDENVSHIARQLRKLKFMPLAGHASGLRQPVHADDLVAAALRVLASPITYGKTYTVAGGEVLSYRAMVERIFVAMGRPARFLHLPVFLYGGLLSTISLLGSFNYTAGMARRMNLDMVYDNADAERDFGYAPQPFLTHPERDLLV